jgi:hypothetical protein
MHRFLVASRHKWAQLAPGSLEQAVAKSAETSPLIAEGLDDTMNARIQAGFMSLQALLAQA